MSAPTAAAESPFPRELMTPPVKKMNLACRFLADDLAIDLGLRLDGVAGGPAHHTHAGGGHLTT
jgi:hypothetical protein